MRRRSKIVCTLGPASSSFERISELCAAGMDVARLNASHGTREQNEERLHHIRRASEAQQRAVAVLLDLQGPKIRVGIFQDGQTLLSADKDFRLYTDPSRPGDASGVGCSFNLAGSVSPGDLVLLDDGYLTLEVTEIDPEFVTTRVRHGGILRDRKGINLPFTHLDTPALSTKDRSDLSWGVRVGVEYIALSFVRCAADMSEAKALATNGDTRVPVIAKIEKPQALDHLEEILDVADGIMVARGDLGVELGPEKVPLVQKHVIRATNARGLVVITATQMLESMIHNPRPTRAEASDVANAVLDGTDALMLSGETAVGDFPVETVHTMSRIITEIEKSSAYRQNLDAPPLELAVSANAIARGAVIASEQIKVRAIVVVSDSGGVARLMSEYRPDAPIVAASLNETTYRRLALYWGVIPVMVSPAATTDEMIARVEDVLYEHELAEAGDEVVITLATPIGSGVSTNTLRIHRMP